MDFVSPNVLQTALLVKSSLKNVQVCLEMVYDIYKVTRIYVFNELRLNLKNV